MPKSTRSGYANAVVVGDAAYLVDCGEGAHTQLWRAGLTLNHNFGRDRPVVRSVFVTHLHADHLMDLANLFLGSWPPQVVDVYGPSPAGLPIASFPSDAARPLVFPDDPTPGIRAATCHDAAAARNAREHNDANVLSLGARIIGTEVARACVRAFVEADFDGGRHVARIEKIARIEAEEARR